MDSFWVIVFGVVVGIFIVGLIDKIVACLCNFVKWKLKCAKERKTGSLYSKDNGNERKAGFQAILDDGRW